MISVIVYGRNDNYGHNLHRRAALSLNCIAAALDAPDDEILFVDYNTPDDLATFPEAIDDTLTPAARARLRILRVRPEVHRRYAGRTKLPVLEPVARNVALRRGNPANRWVLSTNTDMVLIPPNGRSLSAVAAGLADGYYHIPRYELPQTLWEALDRRDPAGSVARIEAWARALHLDEIVRTQDDYIRYDAPGDFQLMPRADLHRIGGFDERILLGWHVDANIARRMSLIYPEVGDLAGLVRGYHCEHTRQATPKHAPGRQADDMAAVAGALTVPWIESQAEDWGLAADTIEEIRPGETTARWLAAAGAAIGDAAGEPTHLLYASASFGRMDYDARHVLPFLLDAIGGFPRDLCLGWFGARRDLLERCCLAWRALGFARPIQVAAPAPWLGAHLPAGAAWADPDAIQAEAGICLFDFAPPGAAAEPAEAAPWVANGLRRLAAMDNDHAADPVVARRRIIAVNAVNNVFETLVASYVGITLSPVTTRIRQGFLLNGRAWPRDVLPLLSPGDAGRRGGADRAIALATGARGTVFFGPYLDLFVGSYRLTVEIDAPAARGADPKLLLEVVSGPDRLAERTIGPADVRAGPIALDFAVTAGLADRRASLNLEFRLFSDGTAGGTVRAASLNRAATPPAAEADAPATRKWRPWRRDR